MPDWDGGPDDEDPYCYSFEGDDYDDIDDEDDE